LNILYLSALVPFPVTDGDKVRAFWTLRALAGRHRVWGFFLDPENRGSLPGPVRRLCAGARVIPLSGSTRASRVFFGALKGLPVHSYAFWTPRIQARLAGALSRWPVEACHVHRIRMMPYAERLGLPYQLDATDSISAYFRRAARLPGWRRLYAAADRRRVESCERRWGNGAAAVIAISSEERLNLVRLGIRAPVVVAPNGLDPGHWRDARLRREPGLLAFVGNLGYPPNVMGLEWFLREVAPAIRRRAPDARLVIAGGAAPAGLRAAAASCPLPVRFAGFVPDVRRLLWRSAASICPLPLAAGLQNKAVQAMFCGAPVVATPNVARVIGARNGIEAAVAATPPAFAAATVRVISEPRAARAMAVRARRLVARRFTESAARRGIDRATALLARAAFGEVNRWS